MLGALKQILFSFFLIVGSVGSVNAQDSCNIRPDKLYLKSFWHNGINTLGQPLHYQTKDWLMTGAAIGLSVVVYAGDADVFRFVNNQVDLKQAKDMTRFTDAFGNGLLSLPLLGGMYLIGNHQHDCRLQQASLAGLQAFIFSAGAAIVLKELTQRPRPNQLSDAKKWHGPFSGYANTAFPSGHSMRAFALATVLAGYYSDKIWVGIGAYALAGITAYGRLISGEHWPSDVLVGSLIGYFIGRGVLWSNRQILSGKGLSMKPLMNENGLGLAVSWHKKTASHRGGFQ